MQDEQMDHIIREAAEKHHPGYNDKAWEQMHALLDKHMPENEPKRRFPFFWILFALLLTGGAAFLLWPKGGQPAGTSVLEGKSGQQTIAKNEMPGSGNQDQSNNNVSSTAKNPTTNAGTPGNIEQGPTATENSIDPSTTLTGNNQASAQNNKNNPAPVKRTSYTKTVSGSVSDPAEPTSKLSKPGKKISDTKKGRARANIIAGQTGEELAVNKKQITKDKEDIGTPDTEDADNNAQQPNDKTVASEDKKQPTDSTQTIDETGKKATNKKETATDSLNKKQPENSKIATGITKKKKEPKAFAQNFAILASGGSDLSFVRTSDLGKATALYGLGLGYTYKRITLRSGFYVSDKIYTAGKNDYYIDPAVTYFRGELQYVKADCKIYEIPVNFSYNFGQKKNHGWFGGAGLSSLIMKREHYDYFWKNTMGVMMNRPYVYEDSNKHLFSVLTLSGGYQYKLGNKVFFVVEPYVKLPLTGIGTGKLKLNSTGILLSAGYKPFAKRKIKK